jgi:predicted phosphodiesterase
MRNLGVRESNLHFIPEDQSLEILDTELAIHGHYGANGARGSASAFSKMGPKSITGHTHSPSITDGHMCVGTNSKLDMGYNRGLSSWAHTNAILYSNGSRALITMSNGRWFD